MTEPGTPADTTEPAAPAHIPLVDHLTLEPKPALHAQECTGCAARYLGRRNACARCGRVDFHTVDLPEAGTLTAFTVVYRAAPGVPVPFVSAVVDLGGTAVQSNLVECEPDPEQVRLGMPVRLTVYPCGTDDAGTTAVAYGFAPATEAATAPAPAPAAG